MVCPGQTVQQIWEQAITITSPNYPGKFWMANLWNNRHIFSWEPALGTIHSQVRVLVVLVLSKQALPFSPINSDFWASTWKHYHHQFENVLSGLLLCETASIAVLSSILANQKSDDRRKSHKISCMSGHSSKNLPICQNYTLLLKIKPFLKDCLSSLTFNCLVIIPAFSCIIDFPHYHPHTLKMPNFDGRLLIL